MGALGAARIAHTEAVDTERSTGVPVLVRAWPRPRSQGVTAVQADRCAAVVAGVDKQDQFYWGYTRFQVATYGMVWQWLVKSGPEGVEKLFAENNAFLLDEFSGVAELGEQGELKTNPQMPDIARLVARKVQESPDSYRLLVTGAALDRSFLHSVLPEPGFCALSRRMYSLQRLVAPPRHSEHI